MPNNYTTKEELETRLRSLEAGLERELQGMKDELQDIGASVSRFSARIDSDLSAPGGYPVPVEEEFATSEALRFSRDQVYDILAYADEKGYIYEPVGLGVIILDDDHATDVKRYAEEKGIGYRILRIIDPMAEPEDAARLRARLKGGSNADHEG